MTGELNVLFPVREVELNGRKVEVREVRELPRLPTLLFMEKLGGVIGCSGDLATELNAEVRLVQLPAVTADPSSGTIPVGYWVWNTTSGHLKRHAGGYVWEGKVA